MRKEKVFFILKLLCIVGFVSIFLSGCMSSPSKKYFQLHIEEDLADVKAREQRSGSVPDKIILIEVIEVEDIYNDYRLVYRSSPYELNYYSYSFWVRRPDKMIRDGIFDYLKISHLFSNVIYRFAEGDPDYILRAKVDVLEEYDLRNAWYAHLKMELEIIDFKTDKPVAFHRFDHRKRLTERKVERVPSAISSILKEELKKLLEKFQESRK